MTMTVAAASHVLALAISLMHCQMHGIVGAQQGPDAQSANVANTEAVDCTYPKNCPNRVLPRADKQSWMMNRSTIIMPCNATGFTDPRSTLGWGIVDFE